MITTTEAAARRGIARRTVQKWCQYLGFVREGRDYLLTEKQFEQVCAASHDKPGRPRKDG